MIRVPSVRTIDLAITNGIAFNNSLTAGGNCRRPPNERLPSAEPQGGRNCCASAANRLADS